MNVITIPDPVAVNSPHPSHIPLEGIVFGCMVEKVIQVGPGDTFADILVYCDATDTSAVLRLDGRAINKDLLLPGNIYIFGKGMVDATNNRWLAFTELTNGYFKAYIWMGPK